MTDTSDNSQPRQTEKPWLVREDWSNGFATDCSKEFSRNVMWFFVFFFNIVGIPVGIMLYFKFSENNFPFTWIAFFPPILSIAFLARALFVTFIKKQDTVRFELDTMPGVLGGLLRGKVVGKIPINKAISLNFQLECQEYRETKRGSNTGFGRDITRRQLMNKKTLHLEEGMIPVEKIDATDTGYAFPIEVGIPYTCKETTLSQNDSQIRWILIVTAKTLRKSIEA